METPKWHRDVYKKLSAAGWYPNRNVWQQLQLPQSFKIHPAAKAILTEFGNLQFGDISETTKFDPRSGEEVAAEIHRFESVIGRSLYPLGYLEVQDRMYLLVDEKGAIYELDVDLWPVASSFDTVLDYLVRGTGKHDVMKADLEPLGLFGKKWRLDERSSGG